MRYRLSVFLFFAAYFWAATTFAQQLPVGPQGFGGQQVPPEVLQQLQRAGKNPAAQPKRSNSSDVEDKGRLSVISRPSQPQAGAMSARKSAFEEYVNSKVGFPLERFGAELVRDGEQTFAPASSYAIPPDYVLGPGDELQIRAWGSLDFDGSQIIDRRGRISLPVVGEMNVAGLSYGAVERAIRAKMGRAFKDFEISVNIGNLRGIRVYVTGFSTAPGAYTVGNLSTLLNLLLASGGPASGGTFRDIRLIRNGKTISEFDLYALLLKGDKSRDVLLQAEDVIHIGPIGPQVAIAGAVGRPAIYEIKANESIQDLLMMSGGFSPAADRTHLRLLEIERREYGFGDVSAYDTRRPLRAGDVYLAINLVAVDPPSFKRSVRVRVGGEVQRPGEYLLPPGSDLRDAIQMAGGLAPFAYLYGTVFTRESARREQQQQLERVKSELQKTAQGSTSRANAVTPEEIAAQERKERATQSLLDRMGSIEPTGRVVLGITPMTTTFPQFGIEDGDAIFIPRIPEVVGVFGSVVNPGIFSFSAGAPLKVFLDRAGGASPTADLPRAIVIRANGSVEPFSSSKGGFFRVGEASTANLLPGDTIYVPEDLEPRFRLSKELRDWSQILSQFAIGAAAIKVLRN